MALLDEFYAVFAENMRDLGTPVYPKRFFEAIFRRFEQHCQLVIIESQGEPWAAAFLVFWRGCAEVPWASCRAKAKPLGANMRLYWELLSQAIARGCKSFDFGRSTVDSGTYRFKQQWGASRCRSIGTAGSGRGAGTKSQQASGRAKRCRWRLRSGNVFLSVSPILSAPSSAEPCLGERTEDSCQAGRGKHRGPNRAPDLAMARGRARWSC